MKERHGFVSNSSSSSFVVALPHRPTCINDMKEMLFGGDENINIGEYSCWEIARIAMIKALANEVSSSYTGWGWGSEERVKRFMRENAGCYIYEADYDDHSEMNRLFESGEVFENVEFICESFH